MENFGVIQISEPRNSQTWIYTLCILKIPTPYCCGSHKINRLTLKLLDKQGVLKNNSPILKQSLPEKYICVCVLLFSNYTNFDVEKIDSFAESLEIAESLTHTESKLSCRETFHYFFRKRY